MKETTPQISPSLDQDSSALLQAVTFKTEDTSINVDERQPLIPKDTVITIDPVCIRQFLARLWGAYAIPLALSIVRRVSSVSTITTRNN